MSQVDHPVFIISTGRSGTTFLQHCLSQHHDLHIHGQLPKGWKLSWPDTLEQLKSAAKWVRKANQGSGYGEDVPHYAGAPEIGCPAVMARFIRDFLTGLKPDKPRWGLKYLGIHFDWEMGFLDELWPEKTIVLAIRDPVDTYISEISAFNPKMTVEEFMLPYKRHAQLADRADVLFQIDRLKNSDDRLAVIQQILEHAGLSLTPEVTHFIGKWPKIHGSNRKTVDRNRICRAMYDAYDFKIAAEAIGYP